MLSEVAENTNEQAKGQKEKNERTGTEEQEQDSKERKNKSGKTGTAPTPRRTRTERPERKDKNRAKDHRTGPKNKRGAHRKKDKQTPSKDKTTTTPAPSPPPHQGHPPRCLAVTTNKTTDKTTNTERRHSCCRPNCTRPFGPRSVVTSTIPALDRAGYTLILFLLSPTLPLPPLGGSGEKTK